MRKKLIGLAMAGVASAVAIGGTASADPSGAGQSGPFTLVGVGSDTVQDVWNGLAADIDAGTANKIASYNATGSSNVLPNNLKASGCTSLPRPNGSGAGRNALVSSLNNTSTTVALPDGSTSASTNYNGCIDFARSSSLNITSSDGGTALTYVPFADDAVSYAVTRSSVVPRTLSIIDLQHIYQCDSNYVGTGTNNYSATGGTALTNGTNAQGWVWNPVLPQQGSGTRSFWESKMNITDANVNNGTYPCIDNGGYTQNGTAKVAEEHKSNFLTDNQLVPFSIPQYLNQATGLIADSRGNGVLGSVAGTGDLLVSNSGNGTAYGSITEALAPPASFNFQRHVYDVVPRVNIDPNATGYDSTNAKTQAYTSVFGPTGSVCTDKTTLAKYHFLPVASDRTCGAVTDHT